MDTFNKLKKSLGVLDKPAILENAALAAEDVSSLAAKEPSMFDKASRVLSAPQRYLMKNAAEYLGVPGNLNSSEKSAENIVQNLADRAGVPEDSQLGALAKGVGVAGLEVFADPLGMLPVGKLSKLTKPALELAEKFPAVKKLFEVAGKTFEVRNTAEALKVKDALEKAGQIPLGHTLRKLD